MILSQVSDGAATQYYSLFDLAEGVPVLVRTAWMDAVPQGDAYMLSINVTSAITGEVLLEDSVPFQDDESALWNAQYERMMQVLLDGYAGIGDHRAAIEPTKNIRDRKTPPGAQRPAGF